MPRPRLQRTDLELIAATLLVKLALLAGGVVALWLATGSVPALLEPWHRWDAPHYTDIAVFGYRADDPGTLRVPGYTQAHPGDLDLYIVFFPLYPALVSAVNALLGAPIAAAFVVSTAASLFVAPMLHRLVAADLGARIGRSSALLFLIFPTAHFLHIGYTESVFLALAFASLWFGRTDRWLAAGLLGGLAALTRANGLVLLPALAVEAYLQWRGGARPRPSWLAIGLVGVGFAGYLGLNLAVYGDPMAFAEIQRDQWFKQLTWPWVGMEAVIGWIGSNNPEGAFMLGWMELAFVTLGFVATLASAVWLRPTWTAWMAGNWVLMVSTGLIMSVPRYSLALFPIVVWGALAAERWPRLGVAIAAASGTAMAYFAWRFAIGAWAF